MSHAWSGRRIRSRSLLAALLLRRKLVAGSRGESGEACRRPWRCDDTKPRLADFVQTCLASRFLLKAPWNRQAQSTVQTRLQLVANMAFAAADFIAHTFVTFVAR